MKIIIIGLGRMGTGLSQNLVKKGHKVTVIDNDQESFLHLGEGFVGEKVNGSGLDRDVLAEAGIERVDAVVICTQSDEINAVIARVAKNIYQVPRVIARLYDSKKAEIYSRLGIQTISTTSWGIERATEFLMYNQLDSVYEMGHGDVNIIRIEVPTLLVGRNVNEISIVGEINVASIKRLNKDFIPSLGTILEAEDVLYLSVSDNATDKLKTMFGLQ